MVDLSEQELNRLERVYIWDDDERTSDVISSLISALRAALSSSPAPQRWEVAMKDNRTIEVGWNEDTGKFDAWATDWDKGTPMGAEPSGRIIAHFDGAESPVVALLGVLAFLSRTAPKEEHDE